MIRLFDLPQEEIAAHLDAPVWLTINPVEYHGPHLSLHNDRFLSLGMAAKICETKRWPLVVADDLEVGVGPAPGPGSRAHSFREVRSLVVHACQRLEQLGAKRVVLMTFHGDPLHNLAISAGAEVLRKRSVKVVEPFNQLLAEMLVLQPERFSRALNHIPEPIRGQMLADLRFDFHAGFFETSLALHYAPHTVSQRYKTLPPCPPITQPWLPRMLSTLAGKLGAGNLSRELGFVAQGLGWHAVRPFPGYTSAPEWASVEAGAVFAQEIETRFAAAIEAVLFAEGQSPEPIMRWVQTATLGGRIV